MSLDTSKLIYGDGSPPLKDLHDVAKRHGVLSQAEVDRIAETVRAHAQKSDSAWARTLHDPVDHPAHYTSHPSGVECITITEHMGFCLGNAIKYIWRADQKADAIEDLRKARWYLDREITRRLEEKKS